MKSFEEMYQVVEESGNEASFSKLECEAVYDLLNEISARDFPLNIVEIGVQYGRSTTMFAEFALIYKDWKFVAIDNWFGDDGQIAHNHVLSQIEKHAWTVDLWSIDSLRAADQYDHKIDVLHIDGDHEYESVLSDCEAWMGKVRVGGHALFDDYGHDSLPGVYKAVNEYIGNHSGNWAFIGRYGNKLGIYKRIK